MSVPKSIVKDAIAFMEGLTIVAESKNQGLQALPEMHLDFLKQ